MGLYDVAMIKDNHKLAAGSITAAYRLVRRRSRTCRCRSR
jgi:nicotinate-nucleotide pyrophosphorylase (carboxylating)